MKEGKGPWKGGHEFYMVGSESLMREKYRFAMNTVLESCIWSMQVL